MKILKTALHNWWGALKSYLVIKICKYRFQKQSNGHQSSTFDILFKMFFFMGSQLSDHNLKPQLINILIFNFICISAEIKIYIKTISYH